MAIKDICTKEDFQGCMSSDEEDIKDEDLDPEDRKSQENPYLENITQLKNQIIQ